MKIKHLSFRFDEQGGYFFRGLAVEFAPCKVHMIQGDNGVGKSTFFSVLQGALGSGYLLEAVIELEGTEYRAHGGVLPRAFTQQVHTVQQKYDSMLVGTYTFIENLQLANLSSYPGLGALPVPTLLELVAPLQIRCDVPVCRLSGGQRQLLAILMAVQKPTKLLLLDEPTATLDQKNAQLVMQFLHHLADELKVTMVIICHDQALVTQYAQGGSFVMRQCATGERVLEAAVRQWLGLQSGNFSRRYR